MRTAVPFALILNPVNADIDGYPGLFGVDVTLVNVGPPESSSLTELSPSARAAPGQDPLRAVSRSPHEMLDLCADHGIAAEVEVIRVDQDNGAYERVLAFDVRYRFVIDATTLE